MIQAQTFPKIFFFTGVSGSGKTTLVNFLSKETLQKTSVFLHFDDIGIPSEAEMIAHHGSPTHWQKATTLMWVKKMINAYKDAEHIVFEGQTNIAFIEEAFLACDFSNYMIILVHCGNITRHVRLQKERMQPELINFDMDNWSDFLMQQAIERKMLIVDTTHQDIKETVLWCKKHLDL